MQCCGSSRETGLVIKLSKKSKWGDVYLTRQCLRNTRELRSRTGEKSKFGHIFHLTNRFCEIDDYENMIEKKIMKSSTRIMNPMEGCGYFLGMLSAQSDAASIVPNRDRMP